MRADLTDITVVLDRSGSMASVGTDTRGGFDSFVHEQLKAKGDAVLTLVQFDNHYEFVYRAKKLRDVPKLEFIPRGSTALLDAIGRAINDTGERLKEIQESERPGHVIFVILTDGQENDSKVFTKSKINEMISHQQDVYKWQFVFLGANQDAIQEAANLGISSLNAMNYSHTGRGINSAFESTSANLSSLRSGKAVNMNYSASQKQDAVSDK